MRLAVAVEVSVGSVVDLPERPVRECYESCVPCLCGDLCIRGEQESLKERRFYVAVLEEGFKVRAEVSVCEGRRIDLQC